MHDYLFKPFESMTPADYEEVGFTSGIEIHQQLLTEQKLFCRCPAGRYSEGYHAQILRHMRPTLSELGEYDGTALMEFKTRKEIIYRIHRDTVCTYEMDDTPPFQINEEALDIALAVGLLYGCAPVDELHIARKQYLDGSIPTGFQRTAIFCLDGTIPYPKREVRVVQMSIEEDSCREVSDVGHRRVYLTDRLGMPLIETVTGPDMRTPQEVAEVAQMCRWMARSTGRVRTGIGAARQDVNVSVRGGTRVEIKGVPRIPHIPLLTYNEARRQWNLLRLRDELHRKGITAESFRSGAENVTRLLRKTLYKPVQDALESGLEAVCVVLRGFQGLLQWETQTGTVFSREIADRVRVVACLTTLPNILHSDSRSESLSSSEWQAIAKATGATRDDTMVLVWGGAEDVKTGAQEIAIRAREAATGIPSETRQALRDGTNGFERILPGADRMYPDTDLPPKGIAEDRLERIRLTLPKDYWTREERYRSLGVPQELVIPLAVSSFSGLFDSLTESERVPPVLAAEVLIAYPRRLRRDGIAASRLGEEDLRSILVAWRERKVMREGLYALLRRASEAGGFNPSLLPVPCTENEAQEAVRASAQELAREVLRKPERRERILMGMAMERLRGRVEGAKVRQLVSGEVS
ncbi:MAG: Glu-tRNA(Gln) amidotransferase subunit GatE [Bacteroidota bacterium]